MIVRNEGEAKLEEKIKLHSDWNMDFRPDLKERGRAWRARWI
jgi:hypothetical protein